ncbi:MAG TPA: MarR family transcriptional regulator [Pirellulales bacterium]|nr:MarR family transcriptional regulator [Pirellulales bacterium]
MANVTPTQGRYLAFIHAYTDLHGYPPAESEIAAAMCVSPPSVHQMVKMLEKRGMIARQPGQPRSLRILLPEHEIPPWGTPQRKDRARSDRFPNSIAPVPASPPGDLYVLSVFLTGGPIGKKFANKEISRVIEIRGGQTLEDLHHAIFKAYDRWDEHRYEFQFGQRPFDPAGATYGVSSPRRKKGKISGDARATKLDDLNLEPRRVFGYWFDFSDDWYHQVQVERIEQVIPTVAYPRVIKRVGKSPPQYPGE